MSNIAFHSGYMRKTAGKVWDAVSGAPAGGVLGAFGPVGNAAAGAAGLGGSVAGLLGRDPVEAPKEEKDTGKSMAKGLIPGVGAYRQGRRMRETVDVSRQESGARSHALSNLVSEIFGPATSLAVATAAGGALGGIAGGLVGGITSSRNSKYLTPDDVKAFLPSGGDKGPLSFFPTEPYRPTTTMEGAAAGTVGGAGLGALIGAGVGVAAMLYAGVLALVRKTRTADEQVSHDESSNVASNLLIPGKADYDRLKRYGATENIRKKYHGGPGKPTKEY